MMRAKTLLAVVTMVFVACGGAEEPTPTTLAPTTTLASTTTTPTTSEAVTTTSAPTTTVAPATTVAPTTTAAPTTVVVEPPRDLAEVLAGQPVDGWYPIEPARYASDRVVPGLTLEIDEPMWFQDLEGLITLREDGISGDPAVFIGNFVGIIPASDIGTHPPHDGPKVPSNTVDLPGSLGEWIEAAPQLVLIASGSTTVMGGAADYWDVTVDAGAGETFSCSYGNCIAAVVSAELGNFVMGDNAHFRIYQLSGDGAGIYVWAESTPEDFAAIGALAERIMAGFSLS